ncbi:hypothetical protein E4Z66_01855 [Aliishimia ponticola]|uniref:Uncharacterized protein n=2 Tax=Aliishimia ponticola TaxID=2499833 RepID=A0A4S4NJU4_9RHOB|nr:hypothetical protein E4Z66_01855 [Aliishimia ponticola]
MGPTPAAAQQVLATYYAMLADHDLYNSRGQPLGDFCAVLQQDRANFHRFGRRHPSDQFDPIFTSREARARIPSICYMASGDAALPNQLARYGSVFVYVEIIGQNGWPTGVIVHQGAG